MKQKNQNTCVCPQSKCVPPPVLSCDYLPDDPCAGLSLNGETLTEASFAASALPAMLGGLPAGAAAGGAGGAIAARVAALQSDRDKAVKVIHPTS